MSRNFIIPIKNCKNIKIGTTNNNNYNKIISKKSNFIPTQKVTNFNWFDTNEPEYFIDQPYSGEVVVQKLERGANRYIYLPYKTKPCSNLSNANAYLFYDTREINIPSENFILRKNDFELVATWGVGKKLNYADTSVKLDFSKNESGKTESWVFENGDNAGDLKLKKENIIENTSLYLNVAFHVYNSAISELENAKFVFEDYYSPKFDYIYNDDESITINYEFLVAIVIGFKTDITHYVYCPVSYQIKNIETYYSIENVEFTYPQELQREKTTYNDYVLDLNNDIVQDEIVNLENAQTIYNNYSNGKSTIEVEMTLDNYYDYEGKLYISKNNLAFNSNVNSIAQVGDVFKISGSERTRYGVYIKDKEFLINEVRFEYNGVPKMTLLGKEI